MPKIIDNVRGKLIAEAKEQIALNGYDSVTIRSIAKGCGLGLGTFYNYFKSKDLLIATFLLDDWKERMERVTKNNEETLDPMVVVRALYDEVKAFIKANDAIFSSSTAIKSFNTSGAGYRKFVRNQVAGPIHTSCVLAGYENAEFLSIFVAESVITWTVAGKSYDEIAAVVCKLFVK